MTPEELQRIHDYLFVVGVILAGLLACIVAAGVWQAIGPERIARWLGLDIDEDPR